MENSLQLVAIPHLPLQIASGILIAAAVIACARGAPVLYRRGNELAGFLCGFFAVFFGIILILGGFGVGSPY